MRNAMILAAGMGSRLQGGGDGLPEYVSKPLLRLCGKPIIEHNLLLCAEHGVTDVVINLHWMYRDIMEFVGDGSKWGLRVIYSFEPTLLGTAGAVKKVEAFFGEDEFFVLYGDNYTDVDLSVLAGYLRYTSFAVAVFDTAQGKHGGVIGSEVSVRADPTGVKLITDFSETRGEGAGAGLANAGVYAFMGDVFRYISINIGCDFGRHVFPTLLADKRRVEAYQHPGFCYGVDTWEAYATAQARCAEEAANGR